MNQRELDRAVARATGETVDRIQRIGFNLLVMPVVVRGQMRKLPRRNGQPIVAASVSQGREAVPCN